MTTHHSSLTLVTGGTGKTGRRVAERLVTSGRQVRIGSRSGRPPFDWTAPETWAAALDGTGSVYLSYYPDLGFPGAAETIAEFARAAVTEGVSRIVLLSGRGEPAAQLAEQGVRDSGADWTVLRAAWFAQNFSEHFLLEPVRDGVIALPAADVAEPFVDADDVAAVAVAALTEPGHDGAVYELTGPQLLGFGEIAVQLSEVTGRRIEYLPVTPAEYRAAATAAGVPAAEIEPLTELFGGVLDGHNSYLTDDVWRVLHRPARSFAEYARAAAASGVWGTR